VDKPAVARPATGVKSECWLRLGSVTDRGYGRFKAGGKTYLFSRYPGRERGKSDPAELIVLDPLPQQALRPPAAGRSVHFPAHKAGSLPDDEIEDPEEQG
jgi:hypothetical protein